MFAPETLYDISYGVYVITTKCDDTLAGFVSNTLMQITSSPVRVVTMVSKDNFTCPLIEKSGRFNVSILSAGAPKGLVSTFGYKSGRDTDKFASVTYEIDSRGIPFFKQGVVSVLGCDVVGSTDFGTHMMFVGEIVSGEKISEEKPLTYKDFRDIHKAASPKNAPTFQQKPNQEKMEKDLYVCDLCGYVYDPEVGDPDSGIAPGTPFEEIPSNWVCPICGVDKSHFTKK